MKTIATVLAVLLGGCNLTVRDTPPPANDSVIVAKMRRVQLIAEIERLERIQRRMIVLDDRAAIQSQINRLRFELEQLNAAID